MRYLLDTNVISELVRPAPHAGVTQWLATLEKPCLSVVSLAEIEFGIDTAPSARRKGLRIWLEELTDHAGLLPVTLEVALLSGRIRADSQKHGVPMTLADSLIGATAVVAQRTLATRNVKDFAASSVATLNPFAASM